MKYLGFPRAIAPPSVAFLLLVLGSGLVAIHLTLTWKMDTFNFQVSSLVFWLTAAYLIWQRRAQLKFHASVGEIFLGSILLSCVLLKSISLTSTGFLLVYPFAASLSLALLASGFSGLRQYWQELILLFFLGIPKLVLPSLIDPTPLVANFTGILLRSTGFSVTQQGSLIQLPGGAINVLSGCSGLELMIQLLSLAVLFLLLLPLPWHWIQKLSLPLAAAFIGFVVNGVRVTLLAILVDQGQSDATFHYWHQGQGSLIFSGIAVSIFVLLVWVLVQFSTVRLLAHKDSTVS